jgi:hypothetical protein
MPGAHMNTLMLRFLTLTVSLAAFAASTSACTTTPSDEDVEMTEGALVTFICDRAEIVKDKPNAGYGQVVGIRAAGHDGYDRFVMEFAANSEVPSYHIARQRGATFFQDGSGDPLTLPGSAGITIGAHMASGWDMNKGEPTYTGPNRFATHGRLMTDAASTGDFEGYVSWGVGLQRAACYRVFELANPPRLVVDVQNNGPTPVDPPEPPGTDFKCGVSEIGQKSSSNTAYGQVVGVRTAGHAEYDRFVMEFAGDTNVPNFSVKLRDNATFSGPGEESFTLPGTAGLDVSVHSASGWNFETGSPSFTGPTTLTPAGGEVLTKARLYEDFEGYVGWGLGLAHASCYRAFKLANPPRLVVDVQR